MNCPKCGKLRKPSDKFCGQCGVKFDSYIDKPKIVKPTNIDAKPGEINDSSKKHNEGNKIDEQNKLGNIKDLKLISEPEPKAGPEPKPKFEPENKSEIESDSEQIQKTETEPSSPESLPDFNITWGEAYLLVSDTVDFGLKIFEKLMQEQSKHGLSISRMHPNQLSKFIEVQDYDKLWLSKSTEEYSVQPGNITKLAHLINKHYKADDKSIVFLDGLEYLINNNDFPKVLKFIESIHEKNVLNNGILLVPVNPSTLGEKNLQKLQNELINMINDSET